MIHLTVHQILYFANMAVQYFVVLVNLILSDGLMSDGFVRQSKRALNNNQAEC